MVVVKFSDLIRAYANCTVPMLMLSSLTHPVFLAAHARMAANGQSLTDEWVKNTEIKERRRKEEEDRNNQVEGGRIVVVLCPQSWR